MALILAVAMVVQVHLFQEPSRIFGVPFFIKVKQGESFTAVRDRIKKTLDVSDKEFEKVLFTFCTGLREIRREHCNPKKIAM
jgi:hypothetical protein